MKDNIKRRSRTCKKLPKQTFPLSEHIWKAAAKDRIQSCGPVQFANKSAFNRAAIRNEARGEKKTCQQKGNFIQQ